MKPIAIAVITLCLAPLADAGEVTAPLTLEQAIAEAEHTNPELRSAQAGIAAAKGAVTSANAYPNPEFHYTQGIDQHFGLEQTFEWPGKRTLRRALAEKNVAAAETALNGLHQTIAATIRLKFAELLAAQQTEQARQQAVTLAETFVDAAARRVSAGLAPAFEKTKAELELVRARLELRKARGEIDTARATLALALGRDSRAPLTLTGSLPSKLPELKMETVIQTVLAHHPELRAQNAQVAARDAAVPLARKSAAPDIRVEPFYEESTFTKSEFRYGVGVAVPLPVWNRNQGEVRQSQAEASKARAELDVAERRIADEVATAFTAYRTAREQLSLWRPELVTELAASLAKTDEQYRAGQLGAAARLELQRAYFDAVRDGTDLQLQAARAAATLERAAVMPLDSLEKP